MKTGLCIILLFMNAASANAQSASTCADVNEYLSKIHRTYYAGTTVWLQKMDSALLLCPTSARVYGDRASIYLMRGDIATWAALMEKAIALNPIYYIGDRGIDRLRYLHDYKGALNDFMKLDTLNGFHTLYVSNVHSLIWMAQCKEGLGDYDGALQYYNKAIDTQIKERGEGWVGTYDYLFRGILKLHMNQPEDAIQDFDLQLKQHEKLADTYYYRGLAYKKTGDQDKAQADFYQAKELLTGPGQTFRRWDRQMILIHEINLSDIDRELLK